MRPITKAEESVRLAALEVFEGENLPLPAEGDGADYLLVYVRPRGEGVVGPHRIDRYLLLVRGERDKNGTETWHRFAWMPGMEEPKRRGPNFGWRIFAGLVGFAEEEPITVGGKP